MANNETLTQKEKDLLDRIERLFAYRKKTTLGSIAHCQILGRINTIFSELLECK